MEDAQAFRPVATGVAVLAALRHTYPEQFAWRQANGKFGVDRLAGTSAVREGIDAGKSWKEFAKEWNSGLEKHRARLEAVAIYD